MRNRLLWTGVAIAAVVLLVAGCSSSDDSESGYGGTTTASVVTNSVVTTALTPPSTPAGATVEVATNSLGSILTDQEGRTLYVFTNDTAGTSTCVDACATAWPPAVATTVSVGTGLDAANFTLIARPDDTLQLAVGGRPLYRFSGDAKAGETNGQGLNGVWFVAGSNGQPLDTDTPDATTGG